MLFDWLIQQGQPAKQIYQTCGLPQIESNTEWYRQLDALEQETDTIFTIQYLCGYAVFTIQYGV